jgi:SAM-dependent methyltransferase
MPPVIDRPIFKTLTQAALELATPTHGVGTLVDLGCGNGSFLAGARAKFPYAVLYGLDISRELLTVARKEHPNIDFIQGDIRRARRVLGRQFDATFMIGTHPIFEDLESWIDPLVEITSGTAYVVGQFNPEAFDTRITWRKFPDVQWRSGGYNFFSKPTVSAYLEKRGCAASFQEFLIDTSFISTLPADYPMTFRTVQADGAQYVVNGLQLFCSYFLLTVKPRRSLTG